MQTVISLLFVNKMLRKISSILIGTMEYVLQNIIPHKTYSFFRVTQAGYCKRTKLPNFDSE